MHTAILLLLTLLLAACGGSTSSSTPTTTPTTTSDVKGDFAGDGGLLCFSMYAASIAPLPFYPELKFNFFRPLFVRRLQEFQPDVIHLVDPVILGTAGLTTAHLLKKPLRLLLQAYRLMDHRHCHLVLVGDGPAYTEVQQELTGLPVTFTGYLQGEELASAYASADVFAFPSLTETFGQVVLEAMASGLPVAGLLAEGVCDLVNDGRTGYLLDVEGLSEEQEIGGYREQLTRLIDNQSTRAVMGQSAYLEAQQRSWHEAMNSLVQGYDEVSKGVPALLATSR